MAPKENGIRRNASLKIIQKALRLMPHKKRSLKNTLFCSILMIASPAMSGTGLSTSCAIASSAKAL